MPSFSGSSTTWTSGPVWAPRCACDAPSCVELDGAVSATVSRLDAMSSARAVVTFVLDAAMPFDPPKRRDEPAHGSSSAASGSLELASPSTAEGRPPGALVSSLAKSQSRGVGRAGHQSSRLDTLGHSLSRLWCTRSSVASSPSCARPMRARRTLNSSAPRALEATSFAILVCCAPSLAAARTAWTRSMLIVAGRSALRSNAAYDCGRSAGSVVTSPAGRSGSQGEGWSSRARAGRQKALCALAPCARSTGPRRERCQRATCRC
jgi:hypothetical protein